MQSQHERLTEILTEALAEAPDPAALAARLVAAGVRVVPDQRLFDADEADAEAERRFLVPINPDPVRPMAEAMRREQRG